MNMDNEKVNSEMDDNNSDPVNVIDSESTENKNKESCAPANAEIEKAIRSSVYASMGIGIVPVPFFNVAAVTVSNLNLARKLSKLYGVEFKEGVAKKIIAAVIGAGAGALASPLVGPAVIGIPLIGLPLAVGTTPALNGMTTYAIGRMFVTHFERGGSFLGANIDSMKEDFKKAFKNSREWLGNAISGNKKAEPDNV